MSPLPEGPWYACMWTPQSALLSHTPHKLPPLKYGGVYTCRAFCLQDGPGKEACMCSGSKLWVGSAGNSTQRNANSEWVQSLGSFTFSFHGGTTRVRIRAGTLLAQVLVHEYAHGIIYLYRYIYLYIYRLAFSISYHEYSSINSIFCNSCVKFLENSTI